MNHQINHRPDDHRAYVCRVCGSSWVRHPRSSRGCPGVRIYGWRQAPAYLQTYTQLRARQLKPRDRSAPDGCLVVHDEWCWLYDEREALPRRSCSERQRQVLAVARQRQREQWMCEHCGRAPASLAAIQHHFVEPGLCSDCSDSTWRSSRRMAPSSSIASSIRSVKSRQTLALSIRSATKNWPPRPGCRMFGRTFRRRWPSALSSSPITQHSMKLSFSAPPGVTSCPSWRSNGNASWSGTLSISVHGRTTGGIIHGNRYMVGIGRSPMPWRRWSA